MTDLDKFAIARLTKTVKKLEKRIIVLEKERTKLIELVEKVVQMQCA